MKNSILAFTFLFNLIVCNYVFSQSAPIDKKTEKKKTKKADQKFENLVPTTQLGEGYSMYDILKASFNKPKDVRPAKVLPSVKTNLKNYYSKTPTVFWFGHSAFLIHVDGMNFLFDPSLSGNAAPVSFILKAFEGSNVYTEDELPTIDYLIITHDHYDHLDFNALKLLKAKTKHFIVPTKVSDDLKDLKIDQKNITELYWWEIYNITDSVSITCTPARHFSGRGLKRNPTLWASFVLNVKGYKFFMSGDGGYGPHFKDIGDKYGPFDFAFLECGQYDKMWPQIHSQPEEVVQEAIELKAKMVMPIHWAKYALANHPWTEPVKRFSIAAEQQKVNYTTPMIGQPVYIGGDYPTVKWWEGY